MTRKRITKECQFDEDHRDHRHRSCFSLPCGQARLQRDGQVGWLVMKIRVQKGTILTGDTVEADDITYVVCYDNDGTPLIIIEQVGSAVVQVTRVEEPEFNYILTRLGAHGLGARRLVGAT